MSLPLKSLLELAVNGDHPKSTPLNRLAYSIFRDPEKRLMSFFTAYFDASGHPADQPFVVVSGYAANYSQWKMFNALWELNHKDFGVNLPFHMADFMARENGKRPDYKKLSDVDAAKFIYNLATLQQAYMLLGITAIVKMSEYTEINTVLDLRKTVPPFALGARACISRLNQWQREYGIFDDAIECIFEDGDFERGKFITLMRVEGLPAPIFKDKEGFPGLQAADYLAWEVNNYTKALDREGPTTPQRVPFQMLLAVPHLYVQPTKEELIRLCQSQGIMPRILRP